MKYLLIFFLIFASCKKNDCYVFDITVTSYVNGKQTQTTQMKQIVCDITRKEARMRSNEYNRTYKTVSGATTTEQEYKCNFHKE